MIPPCPVRWDDIVVAIFERQRHLIDKYKQIEQRPLPDPPISLHTPHGQSIMRDFAWRTVEELAESHEAFIKFQETEIAKERGLEELADATHFFVELLIFAGVGSSACLAITPTFRPHMHTSITGAYWDLTYKLGLAMNFLKNKAWKRSQVPTDEARFRTALVMAWVALMRCWAVLGCEQSDLHKYYFKKSAVIDQRLVEGY